MVLALDTSTSRIAIAIKSGIDVYTITYEGRERHAVKLATVVEDLLKMTGLSLRDVEYIGLGIGPGALTGLRIGIGYAIGVASVTGAKVVPLNSFQILASAVEWRGEKVVVRKARKGYVYYQVFKESGDTKPRVVKVEEARKEISSMDNPILIGDGAEYFDGLKAPKELWKPVPEILLNLTLESSDRAVSYLEIEPMYVQKSIAELKLEGRE